MKYVPLVAGWIDIVYHHGEIIGFCPRHSKHHLSNLQFELAASIRFQGNHSV
ncbi:hypothetical protein EDB51_11777 [Vibrio crassostreae]|nr:hypothetical protein EDB35_11469 [Vibrio crassostreae]CAH6901497.1 conserved hypothetical protein [Vibrio chagasii]TCN95760.1 hypothetical protein EDB51_11777 [Vibrio crassostreae]TCU05499.1 hypothetical protein EDB32_11686 [Vibrio crassostreae]CAH6972032.1 conserved hypothetical protein [Vibrio chagasii]